MLRVCWLCMLLVNIFGHCASLTYVLWIIITINMSTTGGLHKAVEEAVSMGGRAFGLFLRSQRTWTSKPLDPEAAEKFKVACKVQ